METTKIEWTATVAPDGTKHPGATFNPWWGCTKITDGCTNCYADTFAKRVGHGKRLPMIWGPRAERKPASESMWREPLKWDREAHRLGIRRKVFCASMADVFEDRDDLSSHRARLARVIEGTPNLDWLLLTKRAEHMARIAAQDMGWVTEWPSNVWAGTTCEDQRRYDERWEHLAAVPARVRFISYEPALSALSITHSGTLPDWIIVGGESGGGARIFDAAYARALVSQCRAAGVAAFVKQMGSSPIDSDSGTLAPWRLRDSKGGDWTEWPEDLRVREWPL